jgi:hypothetical protein
VTNKDWFYDKDAWSLAKLKMISLIFSLATKIDLEERGLVSTREP